jgi:hypothetical protein
VYVSGTWFTVAGVLGPQPLAPEPAALRSV